MPRRKIISGATLKHVATRFRRGVAAGLSSIGMWFGATILSFGAMLVFHFGHIPRGNWWPDGFAVGTNLLAGSLVSFLFYFLVVYVPERRKKRVIVDNLRRMYRSIKRDLLYSVIFASQKGGRRDLKADFETVEKLMTPLGFRDVFEKGREADEGFYAFENQMSDRTWEFQQIVLSLEMLSKQVEYLLHNFEIEDQKAFDFFKGLELHLMRIRSNGAGYDESKQLCAFIWRIFAGWDPIEGYVQDDEVQEMIERL